MEKDKILRKLKKEFCKEVLPPILKTQVEQIGPIRVLYAGILT
jgi:hypothetical protein